MVFLQGEKGLTPIGEFGKEINVDEILPNMLGEHREEAKDLNIFEWANRVKKDGEWDLKNTRESNRPEGTVTIFRGESDKSKEVLGGLLKQQQNQNSTTTPPPIDNSLKGAPKDEKQ